jgi:hypothetical protein
MSPVPGYGIFVHSTDGTFPLRLVDSLGEAMFHVEQSQSWEESCLFCVTRETPNQDGTDLPTGAADPRLKSAGPPDTAG